MNNAVAVDIKTNSKGKHCSCNCDWFGEFIPGEDDYCKLFHDNLKADSNGTFRCGECIKRCISWKRTSTE